MVHAIKSRIGALIVGLLFLIVGIIGGTEAQIKMFKAMVDELTEKECPDWITVYTED